jgi:hypothetical protein
MKRKMEAQYPLQQTGLRPGNRVPKGKGRGNEYFVICLSRPALETPVMVAAQG